MKLELFVAMLAVSVLIGCTRKSDLELRTEEYDVIEEGTADGWPNDLGVSQAAPLTDTNADTTTSFSILGTDVPADSTALPEDPALSGRLGGAVTPAPAGPAGPPPSASRTTSASAAPPSRPAEPARRDTPQPPASTRPAPVPPRQAEPTEERAPQPEPPRDPQPAPEPEPTPPPTTRTDTAPPPGPAEPAPDSPPSDDASSEDPAARR